MSAAALISGAPCTRDLARATSRRRSGGPGMRRSPGRSSSAVETSILRSTITATPTSRRPTRAGRAAERSAGIAIPSLLRGRPARGPVAACRPDRPLCLFEHLANRSGGGYSPDGFARRMRQVLYCELIEERLPGRAARMAPRSDRERGGPAAGRAQARAARATRAARGRRARRHRVRDGVVLPRHEPLPAPSGPRAGEGVALLGARHRSSRCSDPSGSPRPPTWADGAPRETAAICRLRLRPLNRAGASCAVSGASAIVPRAAARA